MLKLFDQVRRKSQLSAIKNGPANITD